jgi:hypothetical protein
MPIGPMMSGGSLAPRRVARVSEAKSLSTTVSLSLMSGLAALNAATTASSWGICSSFSPVPRPTNHSISTGSPADADGDAGATLAGVLADGLGEAAA